MHTGDCTQPPGDVNNKFLHRRLWHAAGSLQFEQLESIIYARMVKKVGDRRYWEQWANDVAEIADIAYTKAGGTSNLKQTTHHLKVLLPAAVEWGVLTVDGDTIFPGE